MLSKRIVSRLLAVVWALVAMVLLLPDAAWATKGREAVGMCIDSTASGARCVWNVNDKGEIDICNKNGCVTCPGADKDCVMARTSRPKPHRALPEGVELNTPLGSFKVNKESCIDDVIQPKSRKGALNMAPCASVPASNKAAAQ